MVCSWSGLATDSWRRILRLFQREDQGDSGRTHEDCQIVECPSPSLRQRDVSRSDWSHVVTKADYCQVQAICRGSLVDEEQICDYYLEKSLIHSTGEPRDNIGPNKVASCICFSLPDCRGRHQNRCYDVDRAPAELHTQWNKEDAAHSQCPGACRIGVVEIPQGDSGFSVDGDPKRRSYSETESALACQAPEMALTYTANVIIV